MEDFGIGDVVLASAFVEQVKEPLDGGRQIFVHRQDGAEEIHYKLFDGSLGGEEAREEDLRDGLGSAIHVVLIVGRPLLSVRLCVVHGRPDEVERLHVVLQAVLRIAVVPVLQDGLRQRRIEVVRVDAYWEKEKEAKK